jgi:sulfur carrier protein ThiS adenylyltransferase
MKEPAVIFRDNPPGVAECLLRASVGIAGAGGIGSNVAWMLVRAGLGRLTVIDFDQVEERNLNRQFYFRDQTGMSKVAALAESLQRINPGLDLTVHRTRIDRDNACGLFRNVDILMEALDLETAKVMLLESWLEGLPGIPIVSCSGLAGEGRIEALRDDRRNGLTIVGDQESELSAGTLSARVCMVAAMMACEAVSILRGRT